MVIPGTYVPMRFSGTLEGERAKPRRHSSRRHTHQASRPQGVSGAPTMLYPAIVLFNRRNG